MLAFFQADTDVGELQRQIIQLKARNKHLEAENQKLKSKVVLNYYVAKCEGGDSRSFVFEGKTRLNLHFSATGWDGAQVADVAAVCADAASHALRVLKPEKPLTIYVVNHSTGPELKGTIGPNGEFFVVVNIDGSHRPWAQLAYQFAHEFGHALIGAADPKAPQHWFEEAFAECMSLWTLTRMSETWKTNPPYSNWSGYASALADYASDVREKETLPIDIAAWYREHSKYLDTHAVDRQKNRVIAKLMETEIERDSTFLHSICFLRRRTARTPERNTIQWLLNDWRQNAPDHLKGGPEFISSLLAVSLVSN